LAIRARRTSSDAPCWRPEIAMSIAVIAFNLGLHSFYRAIGVPFMYSVHIVFPLLFLLSVLYGRSTLPGKRALLAAVTVAIIANNIVFLSDVNDALRTAAPQPFRVPPEGRVLACDSSESRKPSTEQPAPTTSPVAAR
jgi:hypothetical protein